jgi:hypothetical protein
MVPCVDIFMTTKKIQHNGCIVLVGFIHHNLLSEWFKRLKYLSTSILTDVLNFLLGNKKATRRIIFSSPINRPLCRRKWMMSLSISVGQELWLLYRRMQMKVFGMRRRWPFPCGVMELFFFSRRRSWLFPLGVLEHWDLSRRRRRPKLPIVLELWALRVLSRRRRSAMLTVVMELWALRVSSRRRRHPKLHVVLEL